MAIPWCVLIVPTVEGELKGVAFEDARWGRDDEISISFLDGDSALRKRVRAVAEQWWTATGLALKVQWRTDNDTDIRISFEGHGSWSVLGSRVRWPEHRDLTKPTMNFGWLHAGSSDLAVQEVVLHEFGHALCLGHEHGHPEAQIPWDRDAVIAVLSKPPFEWSVAKIEANVLVGYDPRKVFSTRFDEDSIMLYPVNKDWTGGTYSTTNNTKLSDGDIAIIRKLYVQ